jgi:hypothetical protein
MRSDRAAARTLLVAGLVAASIWATGYIFEVTDQSGIPIYWPGLRASPPVPVQFTYNAQGSSPLGGALPSNAALMDVFNTAFRRWTEIPTATVRFWDPIRPGGIISSHGVLGNDGVNLVVFTSVNNQDFTGPDGPYVVGLTTTTAVLSTGVLVDADIQFNDASPHFTLSLSARTGQANPASPAAPYINLLDVATHEVGHALGLDHSGVKGSTMFFAAADGATFLGADDIAGISVLYPASGFAATTGSIAGTVLGPAPVFGAHVIAVDTASGCPVVSAMSGPDGRYLVSGLPPGRYVVFAEPIKPNALGTYYGEDRIGRSFELGFHAPGPSAAPTVVTVRPAQETAGADIRVDARRTDPAGGDAPERALRLVPGEAVSRRLPPGSTTHPADWFSIQASRGTTVTINVTAHRLWVPINPQLQVLDATGTVLAGPSSDLSGGPPHDLDDRLVFTAPHAGTNDYMIRVKSTAAASETFPDARSLKEGESLYLLTTRQERANTPPRIVGSEAFSSITTIEASATRGGPFVADLSAARADNEDSPQALTFAAIGVPAELVTVDEAALRSPDRPVLRVTPRPHRSGRGAFTLVLLDSDNAQASVPISVNVLPVNDPPSMRLDGSLGLAAAGPRTVQLVAGESAAGPGGDEAEAGQGLAYSWTQVSGPAPAQLSGSDGPRLSVLARDAGLYRFKVTGVETGNASPLTSSASVEFAVANLPPLPRVVAPRVALPGRTVTVRAELSADSNEDLTTAAFSLADVTGQGPSVATTRVATAAFSLSAPAAAGRRVFELAVTDSGTHETGGGRSSPLTARTTFALDVRQDDDLPPVADAGPDRVVFPVELVALDGRESCAPSGETVTYAWRVDPENPAPIALSSESTATPNFHPPKVPGLYRFHLIVTHSRTGERSEPSTCRVRVVTRPADPGAGAAAAAPGAPENRFAPVARARLMASSSGAATPAPGDLVFLDGSGSADPEAALLSFRWRQVAGPPVTLSAETAGTPSFYPPAPGLYRFELTVSDGVFSSRPVVADVPVVALAARVPDVVVTASQPATASVRGPDGELRFSVDGTPAAGNRIELSARLPAGTGPARAILWEQLAGPPVPLEVSPDGSVAMVVPRQARVHTFCATAVRPDGAAARRTVHLLVDRAHSRIPRAVLPVRPPHAAISGQRVELDGSASRDLTAAGTEEPSSSLVYYWAQEDGPPVPLEPAMGNRPVFFPPMAGMYAFRLRVDNQRFGTMSAPSDGALLVQAAEPPPAPPADAAAPPQQATPQPGKRKGGCTAARGGPAAEGGGGGGVAPLVALLALLVAVRAWGRRGRATRPGPRRPRPGPSPA